VAPEPPTRSLNVPLVHLRHAVMLVAGA
jgi:hypothetical protein